MATESRLAPASKKARSPSYPAINLERALELASRLFREERGNEVATPTVLKHWGYSENSGSGQVALSALIKFGLLVNQGTRNTRKVRLTPLGRRILLDERPNSEERLKLIREAALTPSLYGELWDKYGAELPSDENLKYYLRAERNFGANAAASVIRDYRHTLAFAKLLDDDIISPEGEDKLTPDEGTEMAYETARPQPQTSIPKVESTRRVIQLPLPGNTQWAVIDVPIPLSARAWNYLVTVLNAMRPAIIEEAKKTGQLAALEEEVDEETHSRHELTPAARELLASLGDGASTPAFVSKRLEAIANENGIEVARETTPNEIIDALRRKDQPRGA